MNFLKRFIRKKRSSTFRLKLLLSGIGGLILFAAALIVPPSGAVIHVNDRGSGGGPDSYFQHVYDPDHLLGLVGGVDLELDIFQRLSGNAILFAAFPSLPSQDPYFTMQIADRWAPGESRDDRGLVVFLFMKERRIRVEIGYGLEEVLTDVTVARLVEDTMIPLLREGKNDEAVKACALALREGLPQERRTAGGSGRLFAELRDEMPSLLREVKRRVMLVPRIWEALSLVPRLILTAAITLLWTGLVKLVLDLAQASGKLMQFLHHAAVSRNMAGAREALQGISFPLLGVGEAIVFIFLVGSWGEFFRSGTGMFGGGGVNLFW